MKNKTMPPKNELLRYLQKIVKEEVGDNIMPLIDLLACSPISTTNRDLTVLKLQANRINRSIIEHQKSVHKNKNRNKQRNEEITSCLIVSTDLSRRLIEKDEYVEDIYGDILLWVRCSSNKNISDDNVIMDIARDRLAEKFYHTENIDNPIKL